jgi:hypothetical protein
VRWQVAYQVFEYGRVAYRGFTHKGVHKVLLFQEKENYRRQTRHPNICSHATTHTAKLAIVVNLLHMGGLKTNGLVEAMELNTILEHIRVFAHRDDKQHVDKIMPTGNHVLARNRGGRRVLASPSVPRSLWPLIPYCRQMFGRY